MPSSADILASLTRIARESVASAMAWHVVVALGAFALLAGWRPSRRVASVALSAPLGSVAIHAWAFSNPFNGAVFTIGALLLGVLARRAPAERATLGRPWAVTLGGCLVLFAWLYPHFLAPSNLLTYTYAAPLGTIPCPSLALVTGVALVGDGLAGGGWKLVLASMAAFYALCGVLRLGVLMDVTLLAGALGLSIQRPSGSRRLDNRQQTDSMDPARQSVPPEVMV